MVTRRHADNDLHYHIEVTLKQWILISNTLYYIKKNNDIYHFIFNICSMLSLHATLFLPVSHCQHGRHCLNGQHCLHGRHCLHCWHCRRDRHFVHSRDILNTNMYCLACNYMVTRRHTDNDLHYQIQVILKPWILISNTLYYIKKN